MVNFLELILRIFNFNSAELLSEIGIEKNFSYLCLWSNNYLFVANGKCILSQHKDETIKLWVIEK